MWPILREHALDSEQSSGMKLVALHSLELRMEALEGLFHTTLPVGGQWNSYAVAEGWSLTKAGTRLALAPPVKFSHQDIYDKV